MCYRSQRGQSHQLQDALDVGMATQAPVHIMRFNRCDDDLLMIKLKFEVLTRALILEEFIWEENSIIGCSLE